jgi:guanine deaminase
MENTRMDVAIQEAKEGLLKKEGGPFGAVIYQGGQVIARGHNMVLQTNDPTAHAEITCIRKACAKLGTFDLSDCVMYSTCQPCPMCYGAIHWAKLNTCIYGSDATDAANGGFSDADIYKAIRNEKDSSVKFNYIANNDCKQLFTETYDLY